MGGLFRELFGLVRDAFPLPDWNQPDAVEAWLAIKVIPHLSKIISMIYQQIQATGTAVVELPDGRVITLFDSKAALVGSRDDIAAAIADRIDLPAFDFQELFQLLRDLLPIIAQIIALIFSLGPGPEPQPEPNPNPEPPVV